VLGLVRRVTGFSGPEPCRRTRLGVSLDMTRESRRHPAADPNHDTARSLTAVLGRGRVGGKYQ
jgi:hypothetical protein